MIMTYEDTAEIFPLLSTQNNVTVLAGLNSGKRATTELLTEAFFILENQEYEV